MAEKVLTVAILGVGSRGGDSYGLLVNKDSQFDIVALCDKRQVRLDRYQRIFNVKEENCFLDEEEFFKEKRADICFICTQDKDHVRQCIKALELGYHCLLEKPVTDSKEECIKLLEAQKKYGGEVVVCHVLRYAPAYVKCYELIKEGKIGDLVDIHAIEQVTYWHQAHSYVRGNWRRSEETTPMILAKCCHDMDLLQWYAGSRAKTVSSIGSLTFFNKEHQPKDASDRCQYCKLKDTCPYSAYRVYVERWKMLGSKEQMWPQNVICTDDVLTEEGIVKAIENGPYGRCVFACDNNVVDHQETNVLFENGVTANLCMTAFTQASGRIYKFHGTYGDLILDEEKGEIALRRYGEEPIVTPFNALCDVTGGHGGGDLALCKTLYDMILGKTVAATSLESSIESHLMGIAAEESRKQDGKQIKIHE